MKKIISIVLAVALALSSMLCVSATNDEIKVYLEKNKINFDVQPQTINNRTMVPIRAIFEAMGANVTWDDATQTAISTKDNITVKMKLNSTTEYINDVAYEMDVAPVIIDGRTLAPARYVAEAFGYYVTWDSITQSVLISKNANFDISQVKDGTREHPYKLGDTITVTVYDYNDDLERILSKTVEITLNSLVSFKEIKANDKSDRHYYFFEDDDWFIKADVTLLEDIESEAYDFFDLIYDANAVTNNLSTIGVYTWLSDPIHYERISLYKGGNETVYIHLDSEQLKDGQMFEYFTITYDFGSSYRDTATVWFSLK